MHVRHGGGEGKYEEIDDISEYESDMELGAAISACYIASVEEVYVSRCKEDDMAVTWMRLSELVPRTVSILL